MKMGFSSHMFRIFDVFPGDIPCGVAVILNEPEDEGEP